MITLSIGIPTYQRADLLRRLISSISNQIEISDYQIEILIGDDSKISIYEKIVDLLDKLPKNITFKYSHHQPSKGQNDNVGSLIEMSSGRYFCLMHDDDYFLEGAIGLLLKNALENDNCVIFGKQLTLTDKYDYKDSEGSNNFFKRSTSFAGRQKDSVAMAMLQQCPNDGYILPTASAKSIGSRSEDIIGTACDFDFALRAAVIAKLDFFLIDEYTTVYAVTGESVTVSPINNAGERKIKILYEYKTDVTHPKVFHSVLKADLSMIISHYILANNRNAAKEHLFSFHNFLNYLWFKPATYRQFYKIFIQ